MSEPCQIRRSTPQEYERDGLIEPISRDVLRKARRAGSPEPEQGILRAYRLGPVGLEIAAFKFTTELNIPLSTNAITEDQTFGQKFGQALPKKVEVTTMSKNRSQRDTQREASMDKFINFSKFMRYVFDEEKMVTQGAAIIKALLEAQSPRLSNISEKMAGKSSSYKAPRRLMWVP